MILHYTNYSIKTINLREQRNFYFVCVALTIPPRTVHFNPTAAPLWQLGRITRKLAFRCKYLQQRVVLI